MAFIGVPLKTTLDVDFMKPLKSFVNSLPKLSKNQKTEAIGGLAELNKLRNRACMQKLDKSQSGLELLMGYFDQLCAIENKLPITPTKNQIAFTWKDSYKGALLSFNKGAITINDSAFERAAVLFNIGAFMSLIAVSQKAVTEEELKTMMKLFQQAAGVFSKLKEYVPTLQLQHTLTVDLTPDSLSALSMLMIAQAQETIYIKAVKDRMKPPALVKISAQCSDLYAETQKLMNQNSVKGIWEKEWTQAVASKLAAYAALAQYHQSQSLDVGEIGEKISRLSEANRLISSVNGFAAEKEVIKKDLQAASKDNDFIYHERVPEFKNLPTLDERAVLAKQTPVNFPMSTNFKDIFETSLVPIPGENSSCNLM